MKIAGSVTLIAIGAILSFAVADMISGVDLTMVGFILMGAGVLALLLTLAFGRPRGPKPINRSSETRTLTDPASGETIRQTNVAEN